MNRARTVLAGVVLSLGLAVAAQGQDPIIFNNAPGGVGTQGFASQLSTGATPFDAQAADSFRLRDQQPAGPGTYNITGVTWSGFYFGGGTPPPPPPGDRTFRVLIYSSLGSTPTGGPGDPTPTALAQYNFTLAQVAETPGAVGNNYAVTLSPPFVANTDTEYWIAVQSIFPFPPQWAMLSSAGSPVGDQAVQGFPALGVAYWTPVSPAADIAFALRGTPGGPPPPPLPAINPNPPTGSIDVPITTSLSWVDGGGATSFDVYFGTNPTPGPAQFRINQPGTVYNPGPLSFSTTYYWRIDSRNSVGVTTGTVWNFQTAALPIVRCDMNCDGVVNFDDIQGFTLALVSRAAYEAAFPDCNWLNADTNGDGLVNFDDIDGFVLCLVPPSGDVIRTELAGNPLATYPFFEYVMAIQQDQPVRVAIDPTRFPSIVGRSARIYVVANKTSAQWTSNPTLVDVTAGGFLPVTFAPGTIQANTFTVAAAGELTAVPVGSTDIGLPYDVIIDMNSNGVLDAGDYIDGRGDEGGFYYMKDINSAGPRPVTATSYLVNASQGLPAGQSIVSGTCGGTGSDCRSQRLFYPTNIGAEQLPLVVISHGNGQNFAWYDYIGSHLASHGYIVMSHANNTTAGIDACSLTTLQHTDAFLGQLATIAGGVLVGRVDSTRITWIGHSRGGEGVARAFDRITDVPASYNPVSFTPAHIRLISSIAPTDFLGPTSSNPKNANYHLIYGAADGDVSGAPPGPVTYSFNIYERGTGFRQSTYVHGADHNYFNCCGFRDFDGGGPDITRAQAQNVAKSHWLALVKHYVEGHIGALDYSWRQYENLKPVGIPVTAPGTGATIVVVREYKTPSGPNKLIVDDFQNLVAGTGPLGAVVFAGLDGVAEALMRDTDSSFTGPGDIMNGMTRNSTADTHRGVRFDYASAGSIEWAIPPAQSNFSDDDWLSFRACQMTRHPRTTAILGNQQFTVTLRDTSGGTSTISIGAYGGGIQEPYQRTGSGTGTGWQNEFETVRIRLTDFLHNGSGLNLSSISAIRMNFGGAAGTSQGALALDDLEVLKGF